MFFYIILGLWGYCYTGAKKEPGTYRRHPTYRQFDKLYGNPRENEANIDSELEASVRRGSNNNEYITGNWIITKGFFKTDITVVPRRSRLDE